MQIPNQAFEALVQHVGVDLRRGDIRVAKKRLHDAQVCPVVQEMTGKRMAQDMRRDFPRAQPRGGGKRLEVASKMLARDMAGSARGRE